MNVQPVTLEVYASGRARNSVYFNIIDAEWPRVKGCWRGTCYECPVLSIRVTSRNIWLHWDGMAAAREFDEQSP